MADDRHYIPGSYYRICDLTGFKVRAERTRKQWNNYQVRTQSFEERNAQDFVRGRRDNQTVPDPRPRSPNVFLYGNTTLAVSAPILSTALVLTAPIGLVAGNVISLQLNNGDVLYATVLSADAVGNVVLTNPIPAGSKAGSLVINTDYVPVSASSLPASI